MGLSELWRIPLRARCRHSARLVKNASQNENHIAADNATFPTSTVLASWRLRSMRHLAGTAGGGCRLLFFFCLLQKLAEGVVVWIEIGGRSKTGQGFLPLARLI